MALEFNPEQKKKVIELTSKGFSSSLAEVAVAAEIAGMSNATEAVAEIVRAIAKGGTNPNAPDIEASRRRIQDRLKEIQGKPDYASIQESIGLKRHLAKLK